MQNEKHAIRAAFGRAAARYDSVAHIQRRIADALIRLCNQTEGIALDAGAGTGYALTHLAEVASHCIALDQALPMLQRGLRNAVCGDIEALPLRDATLALYYSSLAWQWTQTEKAIAEAARVLQTGGQLAVATLGPDTLIELREAFAQADGHEHVRQFSAVEHYANDLALAGFEKIEIQRIPFVAHAANFRGMLRDLKTLGAHVVSQQKPQGLFGVQAFRRATHHYERLREVAGLPVTYDVVFISARRSTRQSI